MEKLDTKEEFSLVKRAKSFSYAGRGVVVFIKTTPNAWIQLLILGLAVALGIYFNITKIEWLILVLTTGLVLTAEALNTAFEIDINLTSPTYHPYARDVKDVAAGAVLISAIMALIVGLIIFVPYLI